MKNKNTIIIIVISATIGLTVCLLVFLIMNYMNKDKYSCIDYETNTVYTFSNEKKMHEVCDEFNGVKDDEIISQYDIYYDLINTNDNSFTFYPYVDSDKKLAIIITISDCNNPNLAKEKASQWFKNHNYNMNDYQIDYEYPCEME